MTPKEDIVALGKSDESFACILEVEKRSSVLVGARAGDSHVFRELPEHPSEIEEV